MKEQMARKPEDVIRKAVLRMLPRNKLQDVGVLTIFGFSGDVGFPVASPGRPAWNALCPRLEPDVALCDAGSCQKIEDISRRDPPFCRQAVGAFRYAAAKSPGIAAS